jgi:hypothetical protein
MVNHCQVASSNTGSLCLYKGSIIHTHKYWRLEEHHPAVFQQAIADIIGFEAGETTPIHPISLWSSDLQRRQVNRQNIFLLNFSIGCNYITRSLLLIKPNDDPNRWLLAVPIKSNPLLELFLISAQNMYAVKDLTVVKEWFTHDLDPVYRDQVEVATHYLLIEPEIAREGVFYYAKKITGTMRGSGELDKASEDIVTTRDTKATVGPLTTSFMVYVIALPLIVTLLVYLIQGRLRILEKLAQLVSEPWHVKDESNILDRVISFIWLMWPGIGVLVSFAVYSYVFNTGFRFGELHISPWELINPVNIIHADVEYDVRWVQWGDSYSTVLLLVFFAALWSSFACFRSGLRIRRIYKSLKADPIL